MSADDLVKSICQVPGILAGLGASIRENNRAQRAPLRRRLEKFETSARLVESEMTDPLILSILLNGDEWIEYEKETVQGLAELSRLAQNAIPKLKGRGRTKAYPRANGLSPMMQCALIVSTACDRWPGKDNARAQEACAKLWKAAGGRGRASLSTWRDHLKAVRRLEKSHEAAVICTALKKAPGAKSF